MKFKFCSDGDCPLWALAALHATSSLPAPLFRKLLDCVVGAHDDDAIIDILKDTSLSSREESARAAAVIRWTLKQAWSSKCPGSQLTRDLLVLGVPRAHASALADAADNGREGWERGVSENGFMVNRVTDVSASRGSNDTIKLTIGTDDVFTGDQGTRELLLDPALAKTLLEELKTAYQRIEEMDAE